MKEEAEEWEIVRRMRALSQPHLTRLVRVGAGTLDGTGWSIFKVNLGKVMARTGKYFYVGLKVPLEGAWIGNTKKEIRQAVQAWGTAIGQQGVVAVVSFSLVPKASRSTMDIFENAGVKSRTPDSV